MDKLEFVIDEIKRWLGEPLIKIELDDDDVLFERFIKPSLLDYYRRVPYEYRITVPATTTGIEVAIPDLNIPTSYFLGVVYVSKTDDDNFTRFLTPYLMHHIYKRSFGETILHLQNYANIEDFFESDILVNYDTVKNKLFVSPYPKSIGLTLGYGFEVVDYVQINHLGVIAMISALRLCETIRVARTSFKLAGDLELDASALDSIIETLKERVAREYVSITVPVMLYA